MSQPVVHFEIIGTDPARLRSFFGELFDWRYERTPVAAAVSEPDNYGFIDLLTAADGSGIRGGIGGGPEYERRALISVAAPGGDRGPACAPQRVARRAMGPEI